MAVFRRGRGSYSTLESLRDDALIQKLREIILTGREPSAEDRKRAFEYNLDNIRAGKPFRAPVR